MITGVVTSLHQAKIRLVVRGPAGEEVETEALIDTGFDGALSLPPADIAALLLPWRRRARALLADGNESVFDVFEAAVLFGMARRAGLQWMLRMWTRSSECDCSTAMS